MTTPKRTEPPNRYLDEHPEDRAGRISSSAQAVARVEPAVPVSSNVLDALNAADRWLANEGDDAWRRR